MPSARFGLVALLLVAAPGCTSSGSEVVTHEDPPLVAPGDAVPPSAPVTVLPRQSPANWSARAPAEPPEPVAPPLSPAPGTAEPSMLATLVADLAVAMADPLGTTRLYDGSDAQIWVAAKWAQSEDLETSQVVAGQTLHGIGPEGVSAWRTILKGGDPLLRRKGAVPPKRPTLHLMMKEHRPSPRARLEARPLAPPSADIKPLREWVTEQLDVRMTAVGEVRGVFGGGVDRIIVFEPADEIDFQAAEPLGEVALLVAAGTPRGLLLGPGAVLSELQTAAVFDLDGDGVEEVLWLYESLAPDGSGPVVELSYFDGGAHRLHTILHRTYSRVDKFGGKRRAARRETAGH